MTTTGTTVFVLPEKKADVIESDLDGWKKVDGDRTHHEDLD